MRFSATALGLVLALTAQAQDFKSPLKQIDLQDGDTLVFLGDSITHQCLYTQYVEDYFFTRYPNRRLHFHNAGVSGDKCGDALVRFDDDVAKYRPKYVTILLGMNDGQYRPFVQEVFDVYERDMKHVLERIASAGATAIPMTPTMFDLRAALKRPASSAWPPRHLYYNSVLAYYGALLREMAYDRGLGFVDMYSPLNRITFAERKRDPHFTLIEDAVHPGPAGQVVMAAALLEDMHPNRLVGEVVVQVGPEGVKARGQKCQVREPKLEEGAISFQVLASALPWVLPKDAELGYRLTQAGHRLSRESLRVVGLRPGTYRLEIDGKPVGDYPHLALGRGIELQGNPKTPQYQQALAVATLNQKRNQECIRPMRDLWLAKKAARTAKGKQAEDLQKRLEGFDAKVAKLQETSKQLIQQIYAENQPKERRYRLTKIEAARP